MALADRDQGENDAMLFVNPRLLVLFSVSHAFKNLTAVAFYRKYKAQQSLMLKYIVFHTLISTINEEKKTFMSKFI